LEQTGIIGHSTLYLCFEFSHVLIFFVAMFIILQCAFLLWVSGTHYTLYSRHTVLTTLCTHYTLYSLHSVLTTHCTHYTLYSLHTVLTTHCTHYTLYSLHTVLTTYCTHYTLPPLGLRRHLERLGPSWHGHQVGASSQVPRGEGRGAHDDESLSLL
jgi:hypothetical protein